MKKILLVAYHFPPVGGLGAAGSQRMHKFAKHLPSFGWEPTILTVKESAYESYLKIDPSLLQDVSPELPIVRTGVIRLLAPLLWLKNVILPRRHIMNDVGIDAATSAPADVAQVEKSVYQRFKDGITDLFEIPDEVAGWMLPAIYTGARTIRNQDFDLILATGRPWTTLVIGAALKRLTGRPLVVDFRDPWMTNPFRIQPSNIKNKLEAKFERWVIRSADKIVANTEKLREEFIVRFGPEMTQKCKTVINGFDSEEFSRIEPHERDPGLQNTFVLSHSGFLYLKRDPKCIIDAIKILHDRGDLQSIPFRCEFVGSIELSYDLAEYIAEQDLGRYVRLVGEVSYAESISRVAACDVALLLQPGTKTQIPSKVFEYVGLGKRIFTVAPHDSSVAKLIVENDLGRLADENDACGIADAIHNEIQAWAESGSTLSIDAKVRARFDVKNCVSVLNDELQEMVSSEKVPD